MASPNASSDPSPTELLASLDHWRRQAEALADAAECERILRHTLEGLLRRGCDPACWEIVPILQRAARAIRVDRMYVSLWGGAGYRTIAWPTSTALDARGLVDDLPEGFVTAALAEIRAGRAIELPACARAGWSFGAECLPPRSLVWLPIAVDHGVVGLLGCDSMEFEVYLSDERRVFLDALASILGLALRRSHPRASELPEWQS